MIKATSLFALASACLVFSCKKNSSTAAPPVIDSTVVTVYDNYTQLTPGNYWIYQDYKLDSINGAAHPQGTFDSSYVEKDTTINGHVFHKYLDAQFSASITNPQYNVYFLRDR